jgi:hypothetical protein
MSYAIFLKNLFRIILHMFNTIKGTIKGIFTKKYVPSVVSELSFKQLQYLNAAFESLSPYLNHMPVERVGLIRRDLQSIQEGKGSYYLNYTPLSVCEVRLMLNFEQLSLTYLPVCLTYPDWEYLENGGLSSLALPYVRDYLRHLYQLTNSFTEIPASSQTHIQMTLSEDEFRHLYSAIVWYTMTKFRYINFGKDIAWNWDELFTLLLEEISYIGLSLFPEKIANQVEIYDLESSMKWHYPEDFRESVASALENYRLASAESKDHLSCSYCSSKWRGDPIQPFLVCPKCASPYLNPFYLKRVKNKKFNGRGTWCIDYEKGEQNSVLLSFHLEHFFMLLVVVLTSSSFMHTYKGTLTPFNFKKDTAVKNSFITALCNLIEDRAC